MNIIASYSTISHFSFRLKAADARNILVVCPTQLKFSFAVFDDKAERTQQGNLLGIFGPIINYVGPIIFGPIISYFMP